LVIRAARDGARKPPSGLFLGTGRAAPENSHAKMQLNLLFLRSRKVSLSEKIIIVK
jgi:hypothetical protein